MRMHLNINLNIKDLPSKDRGIRSKKHKCKGPEVDTNLTHWHNTKIASTRLRRGKAEEGDRRQHGEDIKHQRILHMEYNE